MYPHRGGYSYSPSRGKPPPIQKAFSYTQPRKVESPYLNHAQAPLGDNHVYEDVVVGWPDSEFDDSSGDDVQEQLPISSWSNRPTPEIPALRAHRNYQPPPQVHSAPPVPPKTDTGGPPPPLPPMPGRHPGPPPLPADRYPPLGGAPPPLPAKPVDDEDTYIDPNTYHKNYNQTGGPGASPLPKRPPVTAPVRPATPVPHDRAPIQPPYQHQQIQPVQDDGDIYELPTPNQQSTPSRQEPYPQISPGHNPNPNFGFKGNLSHNSSLNSVGSGKRYGSGSSSEGDNAGWNQGQARRPSGMPISQMIPQSGFSPHGSRMPPKTPMPVMSMPVMSMPPISINKYRPPSPKEPTIESGFPPGGFHSTTKLIQMPPMMPQPSTSPMHAPLSTTQAQVSNEMEQQTYFRNVDRDGAKEILLNLNNRQEGNFLVRPGAQKNGLHPYSLSVYAGREQVFNLQIRRRADGNLALGTKKEKEQSFPTAKDLIDYHLNNRVKLADKHGQILLMLPQF